MKNINIVNSMIDIYYLFNKTMIFTEHSGNHNNHNNNNISQISQPLKELHIHGGYI